MPKFSPFSRPGRGPDLIAWLVFVIAFVFIAFALSSCEDMTLGQGGQDPRLQIASANSTQDAARLQLTQTAQAIASHNAAATLQAAKTARVAQSEMELLEARIRASQEAFDLDMAKAKATQDAGYAQATVQAAVTAQAAISAAQTQAYAPTAQARRDSIQHERNLDVQRRYRDYFWLWFLPVLSAVAVSGLVVAVAALAPDAYKTWKSWQALRHSLRGPEGGRFVPTTDGEIQAAFLGTTRPLPLARPEPVHALGREGIAWAGPMPERDDELRAYLVAFLERAIQAHEKGGHGRDFPRWTKIGISARRWGDVVRYLEAHGLVKVTASVSTSVAAPYEDLAGVLEAIEMRRVQLATPPLPGGVGERRQ